MSHNQTFSSNGNKDNNHWVFRKSKFWPQRDLQWTVQVGKKRRKWKNAYKTLKLCHQRIGPKDELKHSIYCSGNTLFPLLFHFYTSDFHLHFQEFKKKKREKEKKRQKCDRHWYESLSFWLLSYITLGMKLKSFLSLSRALNTLPITDQSNQNPWWTYLHTDNF